MVDQDSALILVIQSQNDDGLRFILYKKWNSVKQTVSYIFCAWNENETV